MHLTPRTRAASAAAALTALLVAVAAPASARALVADDAPARLPAAAPLAALTDAPRAAVAATRSTVAASLVCEVADGLRLCTHGDDAHLAGATTARGGSDAPAASTTSTRIGCYRSGPRVQAVYARPVGAPDRYAELLPRFRGWAGAVEKAVDDSAHKTKGARHVRFASVPSGDTCTLAVRRVSLPVKAFATFAATVSALRDLGLDDVGEKYLVWADTNGLCGVASAYQDESPGADNLNNGRFPTYARVDRACWGRAEAHELMHMLGAVQRGAPHATQGMHCNDGSDVMCYDDGTRGSTQKQVCASSQARLLDCRGDDYFSTSPAAGSWLATHWNTASSAFLARGWTDPAPPRPAAQADTEAPAARPSPSPSPSTAGSTGQPSPRPTPTPSSSAPAGLLPLPVVLPTLAVLR